MKVPRISIFVGVVIVFAVIVATIAVLRIAMTKEDKTGLGKAFTYNLSEFRKTDPALIKYREAGEIKTGFQDALAIAVGSDDHIYVAGDKAIRTFSNDGSVLSEVTLTDAPRCLTIGDDGAIYVGMKDHVEVYDDDGTRKAKWESAGENAVLTSIAFSDNNVFVADAGSRAVLRYNISGELLNRIGEKDEGKNIPGLVVPSAHLDVAVAPDGLLRVANLGLHRIEAYTFDGYLELWWGEASTRIEGFIGCCNPTSFAIFPDGSFVTCEKGVPRVKVYDPNGVFEGVVAGAELFTQSEEYGIPDEQSASQKPVLDVAVDSHGRILVLDPYIKTIRIFTLLETD